MTPVKFITNLPAETYVYAVAAFGDDLPRNISAAIIAAKQCKPVHCYRDNCMEVFLPQDIALQRGLFVELSNLRPRTLEEGGAALMQQATAGMEKKLVLDLTCLEEKGLDVIVGMLLTAWRFQMHMKKIPEGQHTSIEEILVLTSRANVLELEFKTRKAIVAGVIYARSLTAEPANILYPQAYATRVKELAALGVEVEILDAAAMKALGMHGMLAIAAGSAHPPAVAVLHWKGAEVSPIALVGKGVCFDAGGLCLKKSSDMLVMKWDKAGAGTVAGTIKALALMKAPVNVVGVLGLIENMPGGAAAKPGDVVRMMSGDTVEIVNTDAEGRIVLAECLCYAQKKFAPKVIVDLGTLTLETFAALGSEYAGLYSNDPLITKSLLRAGQVSGDKLWELPMGAFFARQIESDVADMKNMGAELMGENGAAAEFLKRFVSIPWAHIDLAGACWSMEDTPLAKKGVNGFGVRLLIEWLLCHER